MGITSQTPSTYSVRLATSRSDAVYLAYSIRVDLRSFAQETEAPIDIADVTVSDDLRLNGCGQFCEAQGSFLRGFVPRRPPSPPTPGPDIDPCLRPCLQGTCQELSAFATCDQLSEIGCACHGCCAESSTPPSPPPPLSPAGPLLLSNPRASAGSIAFAKRVHAPAPALYTQRPIPCVSHSPRLLLAVLGQGDRRQKQDLWQEQEEQEEPLVLRQGTLAFLAPSPLIWHFS